MRKEQVENKLLKRKYAVSEYPLEAMTTTLNPTESKFGSSEDSQRNFPELKEKEYRY